MDKKQSEIKNLINGKNFINRKVTRPREASAGDATTRQPDEPICAHSGTAQALEFVQANYNTSESSDR